MAIILAKPTFRAPGALALAGADGEKIQFVGIFRRQTKAERETLNKRLRKAYFAARFGADLPAELPTSEAIEYAQRELASIEPITDAQIIEDLLCGWEIRDVDGNEVPYSPEIRAEVFAAYDGLEAAFVAAYFDAQKAQRPEKNSETPSGITTG